MSTSTPFSFQSGELSAQLDRVLSGRQTGYWHFQLAPTTSAPARDWYLACTMGRIAFSSATPLDWDAFVQTLRWFAPALNDTAKLEALHDFEQHITDQQRGFLSLTVNRIAAQGIVNRADIERAIQLAILSDLDTCLFDRAGQANFIADYQLVTRCPVSGYEWNTLKTAAQQRQAQWQRLQSQVPSMAAIPSLNVEAIARHSISDTQRQQLQNLTEHRESLTEVARRLAADPLKVAATFAPLVQQGLVSLAGGSPSVRGTSPVAASPTAPSPVATPSTSARATPQIRSAPRAVAPQVPAVPPARSTPASPATPARPQGKPEVFVVDDSPLILRQFQTLVASLGYQPITCDDALAAVQTMLNYRPVAIFLDINMPGASGFELIKQIRRQPQLADVPVVIMTAEQSQSNQKRAQWAKCTFLEKPLSAADISAFCARLHDILRQIAPQTAGSPSR